MVWKVQAVPFGWTFVGSGLGAVRMQDLTVFRNDGCTKRSLFAVSVNTPTEGRKSSNAFEPAVGFNL